ncbi:sensor histidine kinase [Deinococcus hohokamensis]|uniref:histidine kinase n=1 Tax=Deinococcus hohokamensis TaxID=309883 RepID=A0ABV9I9Y1_9DEIO
MNFFARLLLSHLLVIVLAVGGVFVSAELLAPAFYRAHVEDMTAMLGAESTSMRADLERGMRQTLTRALGAALPLSVLVAAVTAYLSSRRVVGGVRALQEGSRALAQGHYDQRLPARGRDELAELARHFNQLAGALAQVEQGRTELIGNVAHELRAPLTALRGYADALEDQMLPATHASRAIGREVSAMERLVRDLSLVSRVEARQIELQLQALPPARLLDAASERFAPAFEDRGVALHVLGGQGLPDVLADEERALQVLTNLLSNALRHTPRGGVVRLDAEVAGPLLRLTVTDTGPGLSPEHLRRIFERFYRVDAARSRLDGGSGVGLTIARGLAEAMGGALSAASVPGQGSTFCFSLPLARP